MVIVVTNPYGKSPCEYRNGAQSPARPVQRVQGDAAIAAGC